MAAFKSNIDITSGGTYGMNITNGESSAKVAADLNGKFNNIQTLLQNQLPEVWTGSSLPDSLPDGKLIDYSNLPYIGLGGLIRLAKFVEIPTDYLTSSSLNSYATQTWVNSRGFITSSSLSNYATKSELSQYGKIIATYGDTSSPYGSVTSTTASIILPLNQSLLSSAQVTLSAYAGTFQVAKSSTILYAYFHGIIGKKSNNTFICEDFIRPKGNTSSASGSLRVKCRYGTDDYSNYVIYADAVNSYSSEFTLSNTVRLKAWTIYLT